jgi:hypothetical protein
VWCARRGVDGNLMMMEGFFGEQFFLIRLDETEKCSRQFRLSERRCLLSCRRNLVAPSLKNKIVGEGRKSRQNMIIFSR